MPAASIIPFLRYPDVAAAIEFLTTAFGFEEHQISKDESGAIVHAELSYDGSVVMLGGGEVLVAEVAPGEVPPIGLYVVVPDTDGHCDRARAAGAEITMEPTDQSYGSREYGARDPGGYHWYFGTYRPS